MASVVSLLLMVICFSSCTSQDLVRVVNGHLGGNVSIQCATEDKNQHGVYMYRKKPEENKTQTIFYLFNGGSFIPNEDANVKIKRNGKFPSLTITFFNLTVTDSALYWCEFNLEEKITPSIGTWLWVMDPDTCKGVRNTEECPDKHFLLNVMIGCTVFSVLTLLCIIGVIVKVKSCRK